MDKYLITGFSGFVSKHFLELLEDKKEQVSVVGIDINNPDFSYTTYKYVTCSFYKIDLLDKSQVDNVIYNFQPNYILHLASYSSVAFSWKNPVASFVNNTNIFLNLIEQVRLLDLKCRILSIGSSEEYGNVKQEDIPLSEEHTLSPVSPYAVARVSQELISKVYVEGFGMDIVITRSFNHIGTGQKEVFVVSSFAKKLVEIKSSNLHGAEMQTGDLTIIRDFLDVRDVVRAYYLLLKKGKKGEIYNVCSNKGTTLEEVLNKMVDYLKVDVNIVPDPKLIRPNDNKIIVGNNAKLKYETGWNVQVELDHSLEDIIHYWQKKHENII
jgi:GDP-4-dehydro-6-deoxy-D-mannose reductase